MSVGEYSISQAKFSCHHTACSNLVTNISTLDKLDLTQAGPHKKLAVELIDILILVKVQLNRISIMGCNFMKQCFAP